MYLNSASIPITMIQLTQFSGLPIAVAERWVWEGDEVYSNIRLADDLCFEVKKAKKLADMTPVLRDRLSGEKITYFGLQALCFKRDRDDMFASGIWHNLTVFSASPLGSEFNKNVGHFQKTREVYQVYHGVCGTMICKDGVTELIISGPGEIVFIPENCSHFIYNLDNEILVTGDLSDNNLKQMPGNKADYSVIREKHGAPYYLLKEKHNIRIVENPAYEKEHGNSVMSNMVLPNRAFTLEGLERFARDSAVIGEIELVPSAKSRYWQEWIRKESIYNQRADVAVKGFLKLGGANHKSIFFKRREFQQQ